MKIVGLTWMVGDVVGHFDDLAGDIRNFTQLGAFKCAIKVGFEYNIISLYNILMVIMIIVLYIFYAIFSICTRIYTICACFLYKPRA